MMKNGYFLFSILFFLAPCVNPLGAQPKETLEFFYVENSRIGLGSGLSESQLVALGGLLEKFSSSAKDGYWFYLSDGETPVVGNTLAQAKQIFLQLYERNQEIPNDQISERKRIWRALENRPFPNGQNIRLHVFVTNYFLVSNLETIWPLMFHYLPAELSFFYRTPVEVIYYLDKNSSGSVLDGDHLNWLDRPLAGVRSNVTYTIMLL